MPYDTIVDPAEAEKSLEIVNLRENISVSTRGFVQRILDLKNGLKVPGLRTKKLYKQAWTSFFVLKGHYGESNCYHKWVEIKNKLLLQIKLMFCVNFISQGHDFLS